jgi:hypothetical protein
MVAVVFKTGIWTSSWAVIGASISVASEAFGMEGFPPATWIGYAAFSPPGGTLTSACLIGMEVVPASFDVFSFSGVLVYDAVGLSMSSKIDSMYISLKIILV